ncbi:MAG: hypothetical protein WB783_04645 [Arenicellales bacterium]
MSSRESRRQSVKKILGAGSLMVGAPIASNHWVKPVVNAVMLPAHAATSPVEIRFDDSVGDPCSITVTCTDYHEFDVTVNGAVVPATGGVDVDLTIQFELNNAGNFGSPVDSFSTSTDNNGEYSVTRNESGVGVSRIRVTATLPDFPDAGSAVCQIAVGDKGDKPGNGYTSSTYYFCDTSM